MFRFVDGSQIFEPQTYKVIQSTAGGGALIRETKDIPHIDSECFLRASMESWGNVRTFSYHARALCELAAQVQISNRLLELASRLTYGWLDG